MTNKWHIGGLDPDPSVDMSRISSLNTCKMISNGASSWWVSCEFFQWKSFYLLSKTFLYRLLPSLSRSCRKKNQWIHTWNGINIRSHSSICDLPESNTSMRIVLENRIKYIYYIYTYIYVNLHNFNESFWYSSKKQGFAENQWEI